MTVPAPIAHLAGAWSSVYGNHTSVEVVVIFGHVAALLLGGGAALAADRMILDAARGDTARRASCLEALPRVHRMVTRALALAVVTGVLLTLADLETFLSAGVFYLKGALFVLLLANGLVLMAGERAARRGEDARGWRVMRAAAVASGVLWLAVVFGGVLLTKMA